ncbi:unnamed protein product [Linum trigynum]|uniref:FAS1 domain-containing protein n=1 Tax=Linum trigynum TaxID=586398 RepID=A0AAV2EFL3_9ROSI
MRPSAASLLLLAPLLLFFPSTATAHNITKLLASHPEFSTFNHYLTLTQLADEINRRITITVCAVDNAAMDSLLASRPSISTVKNILSLHVLLDYFGPKKLHQISNGTALAATLFQATGSAPGSSGFVNITDIRGGKVALGPEDNGGSLDAFFVKGVEELPYNISVIQISKILPSAVAAAPTPSPAAMNLTGIMSASGCKVFADTLLAYPDASKTFQESIDGGLTVFCPMDDPFKAFLPRFKNLTAAGKVSLLEFFGVPVYMSMPMLKSNNGVMNTLATDGASKFDFTVQNDGEQLTLKTKSTTAKVTGSIFDEQPLAVYTIDKVLLPNELFKDAPSPTPAPAPAPAADAPKSSKKKKKSKSPPSSDGDADSPAPADGPEADSEDQQAADDNAALSRLAGGKQVVLSLCLGLVMVLL